MTLRHGDRLTRDQYAELIKVRNVTGAYLNERQHCRDGSVFCYWKPDGINPWQYIRVWPAYVQPRKRK